MSRKPRLVVLPPQHLGHELHVGRSIVIDMLCQKSISPDLGDCILTGLPDRKFFYESLFPMNQVFDFSEINELPFSPIPPKSASEYQLISTNFYNSIESLSKFHVINLSDYALPPPYCTFKTSEEMMQIGYDVPDYFWNDTYIEFANSFNFLNHQRINEIIPEINNLFIIIHHRYNASIDKLSKLISELPVELNKIIFNSNTKIVSSQLENFPNLIFIENLQAYASLLRDPRCKLLITEWSGAGQIAQYTLGPQGGVWYYYDHYSDVFNFTQTHKIWEHNARLGNYFNCWDFKNVSGCDMQHFSSFENILIAVKNIKVN